MTGAKNRGPLSEELHQSRQERAQAFAAYLKERIIDYQFKRRIWITSATEVGKMLQVSDVTANDWLRGKTIPRREQCVRIAATFGLRSVEVLEAAGYQPIQDDSYNTYAALITAVEQEQVWSQDKRDRVRAALIEAISPAFNTQQDAEEWKGLASIVLQQKSPASSKAEKIAGIIDLWRHQQP